MVSLDDALQCYASELTALPIERIAIGAAAGRVLAEDAQAQHDLPRFDQSAMDGYALGPTAPGQAKQYRIVGEITAGTAQPAPLLASGECLRIFTGAVVPESATSVIPQEQVTLDADSIRLANSYPVNRNIRRRGEELRAGSLLARSGQRISPGLMAALISAGLGDVRVFQRPRIAVLVSGNELCDPGAALKPGKIHDSNGPLMSAMLQEWGYACATPQRLPDTREATRAALANALTEAELVISSGGASVGDYDHLPAVAAELGLRQVFWNVAQKPGKPLYFGVRDGKALLALPGNPAAVLVNMRLHVRTALNVLEGLAAPLPAWQRAVLAADTKADQRRERLLRMHWHNDDNGRSMLQPLAHQDSHMLSNLASANALVRIPCGDQSIAAGSTVDWLPL